MIILRLIPRRRAILNHARTRPQIKTIPVNSTGSRTPAITVRRATIDREVRKTIRSIRRETVPVLAVAARRVIHGLTIIVHLPVIDVQPRAIQ